MTVPNVLFPFLNFITFSSGEELIATGNKIAVITPITVKTIIISANVKAFFTKPRLIFDIYFRTIYKHVYHRFIYLSI